MSQAAANLQPSIRDSGTAVANGGWLRRWVRCLRRQTCRHTFQLCDLKLTGILEPEKPAENAGYAAWEKYFQGLDKHPWHTQRVQWPCCKCGKMFHAHCGLDISPEHGPIVKTPSDASIRRKK